jgi:hypothetical protein
MNAWIAALTEIAEPLKRERMLGQRGDAATARDREKGI